MVKSNKVIFINVCKAGSTFTMNMMRNTCKHLVVDQHMPLMVPVTDDKIYFTTVRNPFDFYASHYAMNSGIKSHMVRNGFRDTGVDSYVQTMHQDSCTFPSRPNANVEPPHGEAWANFPKSDLGMYTFRTIWETDGRYLLDKKRSTQDIIDWYDNHWFGRDNMYMIDTRDLKKGFSSFMNLHAEDFGTKENYKELLDAMPEKKPKNYRSYKDRKTIDLIYHLDRLIINKFSFKDNFV